MLRDRLKELDLKITELAEYLQVSRPTMYKFIEYYDACEYDLINKKILKLFNYIMENELIGKKNVINYILTHLVEIKEMGNSDEIELMKKIKKILISNYDSKKGQFLNIIISTSCFDDIISYLVNIYSLLNKDKLSKEEIKILEEYKKFKNEIILGGNE